jgi:hypothetical protein
MAWVRMAFVIVVLVCLGHIWPPSASAEARAPLTSIPPSTGLYGETIGAIPSPRPADMRGPGSAWLDSAGRGARASSPELVLAALPATAQPSTTSQPSGGIKAILAGEVAESFESTVPTAEFREDAESLYLVLLSDLPKSAMVTATWIAVAAERYQPNQKLADSRLSLRPGQGGTMAIKAPQGGLSPGDYRVDLAIDGRPAQSLLFTVLPTLPPAALVDQDDSVLGLNLALRAFGGRVEAVSSEANDSTWAAANLIDGFPYLREGNQCRLSCGWSSKDHTAPQEVVFSFHQDRIALVSAVIIHTVTGETVRNPDKGAKHVEIWTSTANPNDGFDKVAGACLHWRAVEQAITFPPTPAKYVKVRFLSNHGGSSMQAGEVEVILDCPAFR